MIASWGLRNVTGPSQPCQLEILDNINRRFTLDSSSVAGVETAELRLFCLELMVFSGGLF